MANAKTQKKRQKKNHIHSTKGYNAYPNVGGKIVNQNKTINTNYHNKIG